MIVDLFVLGCVVVIMLGLWVTIDGILSLFFDEGMRRKRSRRLDMGPYVKGGQRSSAPQRATSARPKAGRR